MRITDKYGDASAAVLNALTGTDYVAELDGLLERRLNKGVVSVGSFDGALYTALWLCGVGPGDYVFVPTFTFYSYIAAVHNIGAVPVFLDCDPNTRCVSALALETALLWAELQNKPPKAAIIDNAFGSVADYDVLLPLCKAWNVTAIELCADGGLGTYNGKPCGADCDYGVIGFGDAGGGAVVCGDDKARARRFCRYEYSDGINFDFRLNNFSASLACALLPVEQRLCAKRRDTLAAVCAAADNVIPPVRGDSAQYALIRYPAPRMLAAAGFDVVKPIAVHTLDRYRDCFYFEHEKGYSVSESFADCCCVGMDLSTLKRLKLIRMIRVEN